MKDIIKSRLLASGAVAVGISAATETDDSELRRYDTWLGRDYAAGMDYLHNHREIRRDPRLLLEGARSIISAAWGYRPDISPEQCPEGIAVYALGEDYHERLRRKIRESGIGEELGREGEEWRICIDTAPLLERYRAVKSGVGWRGMSGAVVVPGFGCEVILTEIVTVAELEPDRELEGDCGRCGACLRACPTGALGEEGIDCNRCLSYLTIEHRGDWEDPRHIEAMSTAAGRSTLFGCDRCMRVCPHNYGILPGAPETLEGVMTLGREDVAGMTREEFSRRFRGSSIKRAKLEGLRRNAKGV